jgi:putative PIN family toxin of toxin-antitoxin system
MMRRRHRIFLDTSVIFAAVLSGTGGSRKLFRLGEAGVIELVVGPNVLRECEQVVRRKVPASLSTLAYLLDLGRVEISSQSQEDFIEQAKAIVKYEPDAHVLAEAMASKKDWFITHDKTHFLSPELDSSLRFKIGTPGDFIQALEDEFTQP